MAIGDQRYKCLREGCPATFRTTFSQQAHLLIEHGVYKPLCNSSVNMENYLNQEGLRAQFSATHSSIRYHYNSNSHVDRRLEDLEKMGKICDKIISLGVATNIELSDQKIINFYSVDRRYNIEDQDQNLLIYRVHDILWTDVANKVIEVMKIGLNRKAISRKFPSQMYIPVSRLTEEQLKKRREYGRKKQQERYARISLMRSKTQRIDACYSVDLPYLSLVTDLSMKEYEYFVNRSQSGNNAI